MARIFMRQGPPGRAGEEFIEGAHQLGGRRVAEAVGIQPLEEIRRAEGFQLIHRQGRRGGLSGAAGVGGLDAGEAHRLAGEGLLDAGAQAGLGLIQRTRTCR
jgi:hypothetical protein